MCKKSAVISGIMFLAALVFGSYAHAQQSNFSINPPPIAAPVFEEGKGETKFQGTFISIKGQGFTMSGLGFDVIGRQGFSDSVAGDLLAGIFILGGDIDMGGGSKGDMTFMTDTFGANLELQPFKNESANLILFGGPFFNLGVGSISSYYYDYQGNLQEYSATITMTMFGLQAGAQLGIKAGDIYFSPFAMMTTQSGSATFSDSYGSMSVDIPSFTTTSYGLDITFVPIDLSLSSILQKAQESDENQGYDSTIIQISWHKQF